MRISRRALISGLWTGSLLGSWLAMRGEVSGQALEDLEWHVWFLTNQQRAWRRLPPLERSAPLAAVARAHSADMMRRGYFDHRTPEGLRPVDRVARQGIELATCSENLYSVRNGPRSAVDLAALVVAGWMENRGHRENILSADFTLVGVGVATQETRITVTQLFGA